MPKPSNAFTGGRSKSRKSGGRGQRSRSPGGFSRLLLGMLIGVCLSVAGAVLYFYVGRPPVAVADKPAVWEHLVETTSVHRRINAEAKQPPFPASEDVFEAAARTYREHCAMCHGIPGREAAIGRQMLPHAEQFFGRDRRTSTAKPAGELFWPTAFGVRRSGMPAYNHTLSNTQLWQLALLLHGAADDLPDPVTRLLIEAPPGSSSAAPVVLTLPGKGIEAPHGMRDANHLAPRDRPESRF